MHFVDPHTIFAKPTIIVLFHSIFDFHDSIFELFRELFTLQLLVLGELLALVLRFLAFSDLRICISLLIRFLISFGQLNDTYLDTLVLFLQLSTQGFQLMLHRDSLLHL